MLILLALLQTSTVLRGVTVIDGTGAPPIRNAAVVITGDRISAIGPRASGDLDAGARVLDLPGKTLVPGFIDMHAHVAFGPVYGPLKAGDPPLRTEFDSLASVLMLRRLLEWGVTTVRNPGGHTREAVLFRDAVKSGALPGPRTFTAGAIIDVISAPGGLVETVKNEEDLRAAVRRQVAAGVDYVKLYAGLSPALVRAGVDETHKQGKKAISHMAVTTWTDGARAGLDGIVHIVPGSPLLLPPAHRAAYMKGFTGTQFMYRWFEQVDLSSAEIDTAVTELVNHKTVLDPTLVTFEAIFRGNDPAITSSPDLATTPASLLRNWREDFQLSTGWSTKDFTEATAAWPTVLKFTKLLYDRGVNLVVGTDTPNPWAAPGTSFHREMELYAQAGIPPLQILRLATLAGAKALGIDAEVGSIQQGKLADLVLLDADPLTNISNTRRISWVMQSGKVLPKFPDNDDAEAFEAATAIMDGMAQAVRRQDGRAMASHYADTGSVTFASHAFWAWNKPDLAKLYFSWDSTRSKGTFISWDERRFERLGPDAVLGLARLRLARGTPNGTAADTAKGSWTGVFTRRNGKWALSHEHESFTPR
jgi:imidazolonepropionase-like amidohydrolase/ketosteroid isomerase-like protein